jgi:hypothetical protein
MILLHAGNPVVVTLSDSRKDEVVNDHLETQFQVVSAVIMMVTVAMNTFFKTDVNKQINRP